MKKIIFFSLIIFLIHKNSFTNVVDIYFEKDKKPVSFAVKELKKVLEEKKFKVNIIDSFSQRKENSLFIVLSTSNLFNLKESLQEESYIIKKIKDRIIFGWGSDETGTMYAGYEIAEQIELMEDVDIFKNIKEKKETPFLKFRAVNIFLHTQALEDRNSWYYNEKFWEDYLNLLSKNRWNVLDIHAMYDIITTDFPNAYLYFIKSEKFPDVGLPEEFSKKNLDMLNRIIKMAKERGIKTSFMSYKTGWEIPAVKLPGKPTDEELAEYTTEVVEKIINLCPDLWMIGFRIGESGKSAEFLKNIYLKGIENAKREINFFTRTWLCRPEEILSIANSYAGRTYIEIKYNGEHLGLPYHAITQPVSVRGGSEPTYSYENYTNYPRNYKIIWQVRANGTHRLFRFWDTEFVRRCVRSFKFADAEGFTIEPYTAYYPWQDFFHNPEIDHNFFKYDFERNYLWYKLWGRLSYNPELPEKIFFKELQKRFKKEAVNVYSAINISSKIIPLIYSYNCLGLDHRHMAPEFETGGTIEEFTSLKPLDGNNMQSIKEYVRFYLGCSEFVNLRVTPLEISNMLEEFAKTSLSKIESAQSLKGNKEYECIKMEIESLYNLANYYSNKIRGAVNLEFFKRTKNYKNLELARNYVNLAISYWEKLSEVGEKHYRPFIDTLRMKTTEFTWRKEGKKLEEDRLILERITEEFFYKTENKIGHLPVIFAEPHKDINIEISIFEEGCIPNLYYRKENTEYKKIRIEKRNGYIFSGEIPGIRKGKIYYYLEIEKENKKVRIPEKGEYKIIVSDDFKKPSVKIKSFELIERKFLRLVVEIKDNEKILLARIKYKPIPSTYSWQKKEMERKGKNIYTVELPLTKEGIMYFIEAIDVNYNATIYPDFLKETPYIVVRE